MNTADQSRIFKYIVCYVTPEGIFTCPYFSGDEINRDKAD